MVERLLALGRKRGEQSTEAKGQHLFAEIAMRSEPLQAEVAQVSFQKALALAVDLGMRPLQADCHLGLGRLYTKTGQSEPAHVKLAAAIDLYRPMDMRFWLPHAEAALAQLGSVG